MNKSVTVAILVSVLGFCVIVAICFLTYKLKPRHSGPEPDDSPLTEHRDPSTLSFSPPSTRRFVIRGGHAISASQTGTSSIRSGFHRNGLHSERQSNTNLRQVEPSRPRPPRKDVEQGIVDAVVESTLFMPERSSIVAPPVLGHRLSTVPEMSQISTTRSLQTRRLSWDVRQLLDEVRTDTPLGHRTQHSTTSPPTTVTARQSQIYELPATPIPPRSPIIEPLIVASSEINITSQHLPVEPLTPTSSHMLEANDTLVYTSPPSPSTPLPLNQFTDSSSPGTSTPGRLSLDASRALLRSKYNISRT